MASIWADHDHPVAVAVEQREVITKKPPVDKVLHGVVTSGALASLLILGSIAGFLLYRGFEIFSDMGFGFITGSTWEGTGAEGEVTKYGIAPMLIGSIVLSVIAVAVALPLSMGTALFIEFYAPAGLRRFLVAILDLAAAIPSVIYGLWGLFVLRPLAIGWAEALNDHLGWFPLFHVEATFFDGSPFIGGLVLAVMISPIITSVAREVYSQTPPDLIDGARALGGERWSAIRHIVLPFGRSGVIGGAMLGLGRALGETVAIYLVVSIVFEINLQILFTGSGNVASMIALKFGEASPYEVKALLASGFVLFVVTLIVNLIATAIVNGSVRKARR
jgi:phosphate transport system permease protein